MSKFVTEQVGHPPVKGECPEGCGRTLFLGSEGYVTCSWFKCPNPCAASEALGVSFPGDDDAHVFPPLTV